MSTAEQKGICERNLFAAYVDGELDAGLTVLFEQHVDNCAPCRAELRAHRLFVCELDAALTESVEIPVPANFSRMIAARATSDAGCLRLDCMTCSRIPPAVLPAHLPSGTARKNVFARTDQSRALLRCPSGRGRLPGCAVRPGRRAGTP